MPRNRLPYQDPEFFFSHMKQTDSGCWEWRGSSSKGYGRFRFSASGPWVRAHRHSFELLNGAIPEGQIVCHRCDNPPCINPNHLFLGTHHSNAIDRESKGRGNSGRKYFRLRGGRLSQSQVIAIRSNLKSNGEIAADYGVSSQYVGRIKRGKMWGWL